MHFHTIDLRRWVYFVLIAAVCVIVGWFLLHLRGFVVRYFNQVFADLHSWAQTAGAILVTTLFFAVVLKLSPFRRGQFRSLLFYPPTWLAFFTALAVLCAVDLLGMIGPRGHDGEAREWFGIVAAALVLLWVVHWVSVRPSKPNKRVGQVGAVTAATSLPHNWDTLGEWLRSETPADGDLLNRRPLAVWQRQDHCR